MNAQTCKDCKKALSDPMMWCAECWDGPNPCTACRAQLPKEGTCGGLCNVCGQEVKS